MTLIALFLFFAATRGDFPESDPVLHCCRAHQGNANVAYVQVCGLSVFTDELAACNTLYGIHMNLNL